MLRVPEPKTRGKGARHQAARIDPSDIVSLIAGVFRNFDADQKLWGLSAATLRRRFSQLLGAVGLQTRAVAGIRPFDLGSLRPGGATWLLNRTEDTNLVQKRQMDVLQSYDYIPARSSCRHHSAKASTACQTENLRT